jgi:CO/xanthine dehydrogenase FAD-binding subunit
LLNSSLVPKVLKDTIIEIAAPGIRHVGTLGGNIANASPAADAVCTLIALDAIVEIMSSNSIRTEKICDFIIGVKKTTLKPNEIIRSIKIPNVEHDYANFYKVGGRKADAISKVSLCVLCNVKDNIITKFRIAFGAVGPKVASNIKTDELFVGKTIDEIKNNIDDYTKKYASLITPIDDQRSTKEYRHKVALNMIKAFIETL